ncbi:MAG: NAD-dependent deacylase [Bacteroidota bacterium]|nr:NAD-dependent deacylase [Bacteroidota bacterium]
MNDLLLEAKRLVEKSKHLIAFTGAGISVESGVPPFRGPNGIWDKYDPIILDLDYYKKNPEIITKLKKMFYEFTENAEPNEAHLKLAELEKKGLLKTVITQNIDNLHFKARSENVIEFHGNTRDIVCLKCGFKQRVSDIEFPVEFLKCPKCNGLMKPDFVFFGEQIPPDAYIKSFEEAEEADVVLIIGTTGLIVPASTIPHIAKKNGAKIIEINVEASEYTNSVTDIFLQGKASEVMKQIVSSSVD